MNFQPIEYIYQFTTMVVRFAQIYLPMHPARSPVNRSSITSNVISCSLTSEKVDLSSSRWDTSAMWHAIHGRRPARRGSVHGARPSRTVPGLGSSSSAVRRHAVVVRSSVRSGTSASRGRTASCAQPCGDRLWTDVKYTRNGDDDRGDRRGFYLYDGRRNGLANGWTTAARLVS